MSQRIVFAIVAVVVLGSLAIYLTRKPSEVGERDEPQPASPRKAPPDVKDQGARPTDEPPARDKAGAAGKPGAQSEDPTFATNEKPSDEHEVHAPPAKPLFDGWPAPAAAIVLTGEMHGYVEPCGCSLDQLGGLSRRADLFRQIKERDWPVTAFDTGGLVSNPTRRQAKIKLRMALDSLFELKYGGIALGVEELRMGADLLQFAESERPPFLACNVVLLGDPDIGNHVRKAIVTVGDLKIGATAVFGDSLRPQVLPAGGGGQSAEVEFLDAVESLTKTVAELEAEKPDLLVLMAHARVEEAKQYAAKFPQFDLIVSAGGPEDPDPRPRYADKALLVLPGQKGKHVAVVGVFPQDADNKLRYEVVTLDGKRFQDTPSIREHMRRYQEALAVQELVSGEPPIEDPRNALLEEANPFVGAKVCGECHKKAYDKWLKTPHAKATESLKTGRKGQEKDWIDRMQDPECIACHVTGWHTVGDVHRHKTGYESEKASAHLVGQQCENCHGPGGRHVELERQFQKDGNETEELTKFREFVQVLVDQAGEKVCLKCHDGDNDPHFKTDGDVYEKYWKAIQHPWRD